MWLGGLEGKSAAKQSEGCLPARVSTLREKVGYQVRRARVFEREIRDSCVPNMWDAAKNAFKIFPRDFGVFGEGGDVREVGHYV